MAALEGLELTYATDVITVGDGMVNGTAVEGTTFDLGTLTLLAAGDTAKVLVYIDSAGDLDVEKGTDAASPALPNTPAGGVGVGSVTVDTTQITASSYEGRGQEGYQSMQDPAFYS